ncbi:MAG: signal peptidase I [Clostridia bacterium]|nr:signal peptidase I [Clostridia bacterium]
MKILKKLASIFSAIIFVICLALLAVVIITPKSENGSKVVNIAGYSIMTVLTGSMEPDYKVGDIVIVKKTVTDELKVKDVITFYSNDPTMEGQIVTHRIIDITEENGQRLFETKGDNNQIADLEKVEEEDVIGKVQGRVPYVGKAANFMQTNRTAFFLIVILPMLVIMALEVKDIIVIARSGDEDESEESNQ